MAALAVRDGWIPGPRTSTRPSPSSRRSSPGWTGTGRERRVDRLLSTSFGFGGLNAALVLGAVERA